VVLLSLSLPLRQLLVWSLERRRSTRLTRTTQGCQQHRLPTCVLSRRETADATVDYVSLAVRAHTPSNRTPAAATTQKIFTTRTIVTQNSGISLSEFLGTATYLRFAENGLCLSSNSQRYIYI